MRSKVLAAALASVCAVLVAVGVAGATVSPVDTLITNGSPPGNFPQNKQNEPAVAIDAAHPNIVAAGVNDEIDVQPCPLTAPARGPRCPFTDGIGTSGVYFSTDGGQSWTQPTYQGWTARDCTPAACTPHVGPIGTLPNYFAAGLVSDGDPSVAFGPRPDGSGHFSWANGSRLYYANLTSNFPAPRSEESFKGFEAVAVSFTDNIAGAIAGLNAAWSAPVIVTRQNAALFSDKEDVAADNAATSRFFGNVYICNMAFRSQERSSRALPEPVMVETSTDGGQTWRQRQVSQAVNNISLNGRQGCAVRTDSHGVVYVFFQGTNPRTRSSAQYLTRSFDGGSTFERPRIVADVVDVGAFDPTQSFTIDGVAGARTNSYPSVDIANGAPSGRDATNEIVLAWNDARDAVPSPFACCPGTIDNDEVLVERSMDGGNTFSSPVVANERPTDHLPNFPAIAISPDGSTVYLTYDSFALPWQNDTSSARPQQGVVRTSGPNLATWTTVHRGEAGDARGSSTNGLGSEFLGDYNYAAAMRTGDPMQTTPAGVPPEFGVAVWNDTRGAQDCPVVDAYREALVLFLEGQSSTRPTAPYPCAPATAFGNSDIFGGQYTP